MSTAPPRIGSKSEDVGVVQLSSPSFILARCMGTLTKSEGQGILAAVEDSAECLFLIFLLRFCLKLPTMS